MAFNVHDLLRLRDPGDLVSQGPVPKWVNQSLFSAPWVVVRRASMKEEFIPVGVRGLSRGERFAAFLHSSSVVERVIPEALSALQVWEKMGRRKELSAIQALSHVHAALRMVELSWGPVGSVGFELASGVPAVHQTSDLDLIVRLSDFNIPTAITKKLLGILHQAGVRVEILLESAVGAISFLEFSSGQPTLALRTVNGPRLTTRGNVSACRRLGVSAFFPDSSLRRDPETIPPHAETPTGRDAETFPP